MTPLLFAMVDAVLDHRVRWARTLDRFLPQKRPRVFAARQQLGWWRSTW